MNDFQENTNFVLVMDLMLLNSDFFTEKEFTDIMGAHMGVGFVNAVFNKKAYPPCENKIECTLDCIVSSFCVHRKIVPISDAEFEAQCDTAIKKCDDFLEKLKGGRS